jgi:hypothetical protein
VIQRRIANLTATVRDEVEAEHAAEAEARQAELDAQFQALAKREQAVAEGERQARPSYRARFAAAGAGVVLAADVLVRAVA